MPGAYLCGAALGGLREGEAAARGGAVPCLFIGLFIWMSELEQRRSGMLLGTWGDGVCTEPGFKVR